MIKNMKTIHATSYPVLFKKDAYTTVNSYLKNTPPSTIFILVDENTNQNCLPKFIGLLETEAVIEIIEIDSGEIHKNLETCESLWNVLTELGADRKSLLFNLGGGVITDMGGFVAATYKRGIAFINIPTTLLSMVDASVGGKTGVDLGVLKNQIGLFADPEMVVIDPEFLETVPQKEIISGTAEIIKYGLTYDAKLWEDIKSNGLDNIEYLLQRSIEIKNEVVLEDRLEANLRKILNFGHTIGHAVESYFLESEEKETLTHGEAIALGMICETYLSHKLFDFPKEALEEIKSEITTIFGKVAIVPEDFTAVLELLKHDKKNLNGQVNFVLLSAIETCEIDCKVPTELIMESIEYYLS
jgi:3-dehydroquinate synthase